MAPNTVVSSSLLDAARALSPRINSCAQEAEAGRRLPLPLVDAMVEAGFFRMLVPAAFGGSEVTPVTYMDVIEELAHADGAAGWCVLISTSSMWQSVAKLQPDVAASMFGSAQSALMAGSAVPRGRAAPVEGGYRVTGRWTMGSGIQHSRWVMAGCMVMDGDAPARDANGAPRIRMTVFPAADAEVIDTWTSTGLRGTGSHDFAISNLFIPEEHTFSSLDRPQQSGPLYHLPFMPQLAHAAHALGIARAASDEFLDLAGAKTPTWSPSRNVLRDRPTIQAKVARAEALTGSARSYLYDRARELWAIVLAGERPTAPQRARFRLAIANAMTSSVEAIDLLYGAAGASAVYAASPLDRCFRDIHTAAAHVWVAPETYELVGRILLGLDPGTLMI
jgi:indole-3-acetate monooxygenase